MEPDEDDAFKKRASIPKRKATKISKARKTSSERVEACKRKESVSCCPICQYPLETKNHLTHIQLCKGPSDGAEECVNSIYCEDSNLAHYREYSHYKLALMRSSGCNLKKRKNSTNHSPDPKFSEGNSTKKQRNDECQDLQVLTSDTRQNCCVTGKIIHTENNIVSKNISVNNNLSNLSCKKDINSRDKLHVDHKIQYVMENDCTELNQVVPHSPILLKLLSPSSGSKVMEIHYPSILDFEDISVSLSKTCHCMDIKCIIGKSEERYNAEFKEKCMESKVVIDLSTLGLTEILCKEMPSVLLNVLLNCTVSKVTLARESPEKMESNEGSGTNSRSYKKEIESHDILNLEKSECSSSLHNSNDKSSDYEIEDVGNNGIEKAKEMKAKWKQIFSKKQTDVLNINLNENDHRVGKGIDSRRIPRKCPPFKIIPGTSFAVDAFQYGTIEGITYYFLTHFHSDHYGGLRKSFNHPIICSSITASLVAKKLYVNQRYLKTVEHQKTFILGNVQITPLDANHCPGSFMFLFKLNSGVQFLHVGDFRACVEMESYPALAGVNIDILFLDTTYCNPRFEFPTQDDVISGVVRATLTHLKKEPSTLIVCGTYTIGKEKVFLGIANAINSKIWAEKKKCTILKMLRNNDLTNRLVEYPWEAQVHVWSMMSLNHQTLQQHLRDCQGIFKHVVAFNPSGWNFRGQHNLHDLPSVTRGNVTIFSVPYSEHSSYSELRNFVKFLKPTKVVPTVRPQNMTLSVVAQHCTKWLTECDDDKRPLQAQQKLTSFFSLNPVQTPL